MPVLVSKEGAAENLTPEQAQLAIQSGSHDLPMIDPEGNHVLVPYTDAQEVLSKGFKQPDAKALQGMLDNTKYGSTSEQIKTGLEGAASAATFGLSTGAERMLGVSSKDINKRREVNPGVHALGEAAGLIGSMATGIGEGAMLGKMADAVVPRLAENFIGRVGSAAAKGAAENMLFTSGDEASKLMSSDPIQAAGGVETALAHIGLSGALGGAIGGGLGITGELWKMGPGKKLEGMLTALKDRSGGVPAELKATAGIEIDPMVESALSDNPYAQKAFIEAREGSSHLDSKIQEKFNSFNENMQKAAGTALGKSPEDVEHIIGRNMSEYETGKEVQKALSNKFKELYEPIQKSYGELEAKFKDAIVHADVKSDMVSKVANKISELGLNKSSAAADQLKMAQGLMDDITKQQTVADLKLLAENLKPKDPSMYGIAKELRGIVHEGKDLALTSAVGKDAPELIAQFNQTQSQYRSIKDLISDMNDRLHVGKHGGPESFLSKLNEMAPEDVLKRLGPKGDKELGMLMDQTFPEVSSAVKAHELNKIIQASGKDGQIDLKKLFNNLERMGKDVRDYSVPQKMQQKLGAIQQVMERVPSRASFDKRFADKVWTLPNSAIGLMSMLYGATKNPVTDFIIGNTVGAVGREAAGGIRYAMLKFLASSAEVSAEGLSAAAKLANATIKGEKLLTDSIKNVFGTGGKLIAFPTPRALEALEKQVQRVANQDPKQSEELMSIGQKAGHYMPEHAGALGLTASRNLQYLANLKPVEAPVSPLDNKVTPNSEQQGNYQRALTIAEQPLVILAAVKKGNITTKDIGHLRALYPQLYQRMNQKLMDEMVKNATETRRIPYKTKLGISTFMAQPLDSSMSVNSLLNIQQSFQGQQMQNPQQQLMKPTQNGMNKLDKLPDLHQSTLQRRESHRGGRH